MNPSKIPWTDLTLNVVTGCSHISAACDGCWAEALLEDLGPVDLAGYHWAVVGGYSGPGWRDRVMDHAWARGLREQCRRDGLAFYFKQSSGIRDNTNPYLDGVMVREFPELLVREVAA